MVWCIKDGMQCVCVFGLGVNFKKKNNKIKHTYVLLFLPYVCCRGREFVFTADREDQYKHGEEAVVVPYSITPCGSRGKIGGHVKFSHRLW